MDGRRPIPFQHRTGRPPRWQRRPRSPARFAPYYVVAVALLAGVAFNREIGAWLRTHADWWPMALAAGAAVGATASYLLLTHGWRLRRLANQPSNLRPGEIIAVLSPRVIDGDTVDDAVSGVRYRLPNIDAPETGDRARCIAERMLGERAAAVARAIVSRARTVEARGIGKLDIHGRTLAYIIVDGEDLGELMLKRGVARPWRGRRERWCAYTWDWKLGRS